MGTFMDKKLREVEEIEANQKALLESIEQTKELAEKADDLLKKHKQTIEDEQAGNG